MGTADQPDPGQLLALARQADDVALGRLMETYRNYLRTLAQLHIDRRLQGKADASDLVQETFLEAHRGFGNFRGTTEAEVLKWLRRILASRLTALVRRFYKAERRNVRLERTIEEYLDWSSSRAAALASSESSASTKAARREQTVVLATALGRLPAHYRRVILLRHFEELSFPQVAAHAEITG